MEPIRIRLERNGRRGKTVTIIEGFNAHQDRLEELARKIKIDCGTGGTVKSNSIEIQGDLQKRVLEYLQKQGFLVKKS